LLAQFHKGSGVIPLDQPTNQERVLQALLIDRAQQVQEQKEASRAKQVKLKYANS
jgi:hypothetical protein